MPENVSWYSKFTPYIKDAIYIIGIIVSTYGWISSKAEAKATLETTIKYNTEAIEKFEQFMNKQIELNTKQAELDGQYTQFIKSHRQ
jgi:hypothetical protein